MVTTSLFAKATAFRIFPLQTRVGWPKLNLWIRHSTPCSDSKSQIVSMYFAVHFALKSAACSTSRGRLSAGVREIELGNIQEWRILSHSTSYGSHRITEQVKRRKRIRIARSNIMDRPFQYISDRKR